MTSPPIDLDRLMKLRLVVARFGEMDGARWWNTKGQLGIEKLPGSDLASILRDLQLVDEIGLEEKGQLARFEEEYRRILKKEWRDEKGKVAFALGEASRVMQSLDPDTYPMADSWVKAVKNRADITAGKLQAAEGEG